MHSANYAVAGCPSVRPSVTRLPCVKAAKRVIRLFLPVGSHTNLVFQNQTVWQYANGRMQGL